MNPTKETTMTVAAVREVLNVDSVSLKAGMFTVRRGFFYRSGGTSDKLAAHVLEQIPSAVIEDHGEVWKTFRGGATTAQQSHWWVKFRVPTSTIQNES